MAAFLFGRWIKASNLEHGGPPRSIRDQLSLRLGADTSEWRRGKLELFWSGMGPKPPFDSVEAIQGADGIFTFVAVDDADGEAFVGTDRVGVGALYYGWDGDDFVFSTSLTLIKNALGSPSISIEAWEELCVLGDVVGDKSVVQGVSRLGYGKRIRLRRDEIVIETVWSPAVPEPYGDMPTFLNENNQLLDQAMARLAGDDCRMVVPLSGGDDSRRLALSAARTGHPASCISQSYYGPDGTDEDTPVAELVARHLNLPLEITPLQDDAPLFANLKLANDLVNWEYHGHFWAVAMAQAVPARALVVDGIGFDVTINGSRLHAKPAYLQSWTSPQATADLMLARPSAPRLRRRSIGRIRQELAAAIERIPASPVRFNQYWILSHSRRAIGSWHQIFFRYGHGVAAPFFERSVFDHCFRIDPTWSATMHGQQEAMRLLDPALAEIPSTRRGLPDGLKRDWRRRANAFSRYWIRHTRLRDEAFDLLGMSRADLALRRLLALGRTERIAWAFAPLARFSRCLDWLDSRDDPFGSEGHDPLTRRQPQPGNLQLS